MCDYSIPIYNIRDLVGNCFMCDDTDFSMNPLFYIMIFYKLIVLC